MAQRAYYSLGAESDGVTTTTRQCLGTWTPPSGNNCTAYAAKGDGVTHTFALEWDCPLSREDRLYFKGSILPKLAERLGAFVEQPG